VRAKIDTSNSKYRIPSMSLTLRYIKYKKIRSDGSPARFATLSTAVDKRADYAR